jgi:hypothetical protein
MLLVEASAMVMISLARLARMYRRVLGMAATLRRTTKAPAATPAEVCGDAMSDTSVAAELCPSTGAGTTHPRCM